MDSFPFLHLVEQAAQGKYFIIIYRDLSVDYFVNNTGNLSLVSLVIVAL